VLFVKSIERKRFLKGNFLPDLPTSEFCSIYMNPLKDKKVKGKTIPVRDRGSPWGCETLRLTYFIQNLFREAVRL
jgi:hypothetical protein